MSRSVGLVALMLAVADVAHANPDPVALLRGVEASRGSLRGVLRLTMTSTRVRPPTKEPRVVKIWIDFDGDKRRFIREEKAFAIRAPRPGETPSPEDQYKAIGRDKVRAIELGLGRWEKIRVRAAYDGTQVFGYWEQGGASIKDPAGESTEMCIDPRIIGISRIVAPRRTIADSLAYRIAKSIRLVGQESLRDTKVWHVLVVHPIDDIEFHFWIEDREGHRVHRFEYRAALGVEVPTLSRQDSFYSGSSPLPDRVEEVNIDTSGESHVTFTFDFVELGKAPDPLLFGFNGLELPLGEEVTDYRLSRTVGFWDGEKLVQDRAEAVKKAVADQSGKGGWDWLTILLVAVAVVGAGGLVYFYIRRRVDPA